MAFGSNDTRPGPHAATPNAGVILLEGIGAFALAALASTLTAHRGAVIASAITIGILLSMGLLYAFADGSTRFPSTPLREVWPGALLVVVLFGFTLWRVARLRTPGWQFFGR